MQPFWGGAMARSHEEPRSANEWVKPGSNRRAGRECFGEQKMEIQRKNEGSPSSCDVAPNPALFRRFSHHPVHFPVQPSHFRRSASTSSAASSLASTSADRRGALVCRRTSLPPHPLHLPLATSARPVLDHPHRELRAASCSGVRNGRARERGPLTAPHQAGGGRPRLVGRARHLFGARP